MLDAETMQYTTEQPDQSYRIVVARYLGLLNDTLPPLRGSTRRDMPALPPLDPPRPRPPRPPPLPREGLWNGTFIRLGSFFSLGSAVCVAMLASEAPTAAMRGMR